MNCFVIHPSNILQSARFDFGGISSIGNITSQFQCDQLTLKCPRHDHSAYIRLPRKDFAKSSVQFVRVMHGLASIRRTKKSMDSRSRDWGLPPALGRLATWPCCWYWRIMVYAVALFIPKFAARDTESSPCIDETLYQPSSISIGNAVIPSWWHHLCVDHSKLTTMSYTELPSRKCLHKQCQAAGVPIIINSPLQTAPSFYFTPYKILK